MKKEIKFILSIIVIVMILLSSYKISNSPLINLITRNETTGKIEYVSISSNWNSEEIDTFISDDFKLYNADSDSFSSYISNNKVLNKINNIALEDSAGTIVKNDEIITGIFESAEKIEHDILEFQIFKVVENYFVLVKLNVNWQSPCDLYEYDTVDKELKLLHKFQDVDIIGLSLAD